MNKEDILKIVEEQMRKSQYSVSTVPFHVQNNLDAPKLNFIGLGDTPSTYSGHAGDVATVNSTETALEFIPGSGGAGTVTTVSVTTANGFAGTVANATTTPAITLSTTITGI